MSELQKVRAARLVRVFRALRLARGRQLRARALRPINRRRRGGRGAPPRLHAVETPRELWQSSAFAASDRIAARIPEGIVEVLGATVPYPPSSWSDASLERLRRFHLNYGEEILGCARRGECRYVEAASKGLDAWIHSNPPGGDMWHPYPLSTRVGNWLAALALAPELGTSAIATSLWQQLQYLARNVEDDVLGNHVIRNARALVLGGAAFQDDALLDRGRRLVERELPEQVLPDGGHYERSPVYHLIVLRDLLEIRAVTDVPALDDSIHRMRAFAAALARPDGQPALFNDGGLDIAPQLELPDAPNGLAVFPETGYAVLRRGDVWLAFDCGPPAPPFLPPHAHADALSFQLWWRGQPVVVDPGTYTYDPGPERDWFRGTRAHSTIAIDGRDQFELWGAFRAGPFPRVELVEASDTAVVAHANVRGVRHERRIVIENDSSVVVRDRLAGEGEHRLESSLPLAPSASVHVDAIGPLRLERDQRPLSDRFFERQLGPANVLHGDVHLPVELGWSLGLDGDRSDARRS